MAPWTGLALKLYHEDLNTKAPYQFKHQMRLMNRKMRDYVRGRSGRVHVFLFHNKEAFESAISSPEVTNLIEELGFRALSDEQKRLGEDARTVFVKKLDVNFFYEMFIAKTVEIMMILRK